MRTLIIGGTRNLGPSIVSALLEQGHQVTVFHRGLTVAELPREVQVIHGDRSDAPAFARLIGPRDFDAVIDTTLYNGTDARHAAEFFRGRTGCYIVLSTGQVYLVREGLSRPFREQDYDGPTIPEPAPEDSFNHENWSYGMGKRAVEDSLKIAAAAGFPAIILRLPMVNSERDHFHRILGYLLRLWDGAPLLIPEGDGLPLRHVYGEDVIAAILACLTHTGAGGRAYNISQDESLSLEKFLRLLAEAAGTELQALFVPRHELESEHLLPDCSPFSDPWMSSVSNDRSKLELGMHYTQLCIYLPLLVEHYKRGHPAAPGYRQRQREIAFALSRRPSQ